MIPRIYSAGTTDFESNGEGLLIDSYDWHVVEESNEDFTAEFKYPIDAPLMEFLKIGNIIKTDASTRLKNQKFRIYKIQPQLEYGYTYVYARHTSFSTLYDFIPTEINIASSQSCEYALNQIFQNSIQSKHIKGKSDIVNGQNYSIGYVTPAEAIKGVKGSIIDTYGNGAHIVRDNSVEETISVVNNRGQSNNILIAYGKNLSGFTGDEDDSDVITRMIPFANTQDSEGYQITYRPSSYTYVDAPNINDYDMIYTRAMDMTSKFQQDEEVTDEKLHVMCEQYYNDNKCNYPKMTYEITFEELDISEMEGNNLNELYNLGMQDTVLVWNSKFNIRTETRIIETDYNPLIDGYNSLVLGDPRSNMVSIIGSDAVTETVQNATSEDNVFDLASYPDTLPMTPTLTASPLVASIELSWTYISKPYYEYELYGSQTQDFIPSTFNMLYSGQASTFLHQAQPNQTWYYKVRCKNTHKHYTDFSEEVTASTIKIDDASNWIEKAAIGDALIGTLKLDRGWVGQLRGNWIDAKELTVTDGNGKRTLDIDSFGNVSLDVNSLKIESKDVATKSLVTQTANEIKYEFQQGGGFPNLVANGSPTQTNDNTWWYWNATKYTGDNNYTELGFYSNKTSDNSCCLGSAWMVVTPGKTYSISFWVYCEPNVVNPHVVAKCGDSNYENLQYPKLCDLKLGDPNGTKWYKYKVNWTAPSGITRMQLCFHQQNHTQDVNYVTRIDQVMVIEGRDIFPTKWYPKFQEVESNTTTINKDGVNVKHSNGSRTNLNATALNFYNSSDKLYAQVTNGQYHFWNGNQYIGYMGHTAWADTNDQERVIVLASEYGCSTSLSSRTSSNSKYQTWVATFGKDTQVNNTTFHQGCTLTSPHLSGVFKLYGTSAMTDSFPAQIYHATDGQLAMFGDNKVAIGVMNGTELRTGIMITEDGGASNKNRMDFYGSVNMNGYSITNAQSVNNLSATSAQTYALRTMSDEESYSDPTAKAITDIFPSQTPTEGEIRWTDRETHFTSEVENGVYECYIEIPWWIAQNLENNYHVNITPRNGFYQYYISENDPYYFIVRSDKDSMGFTFEIVGKLLDNNTTANNASIASDQYGASASEAPDIIPEFDITEIEPPVPETEV